MKGEIWMVTDQQVRRLFKLNQVEKYFGIAAMKAGMDEKTARKYRGTCKLNFFGNEQTKMVSCILTAVRYNN